MPLLLYIQVKSAEDIRFGNPYAALAKTNSELLLLDADNHSEELVIHHQLQMIEEATRVVLILDVQEGVAPGKVTRLLEKLLRQKQGHLSVFLQGKNQVIERMLKVTKTRFQSVSDEKVMHTSVGELITKT